uniref:Uncharacterized protein n=1 Tax=Arundo donax TaxID=35708 RepID=A0A0A8ZWL0_ARUDO
MHLAQQSYNSLNILQIWCIRDSKHGYPQARFHSRCLSDRIAHKIGKPLVWT